MQTPMRDGTDLAPKNESTPNVSTEGFWTRERGKVNHSAGHAATHSYWDTTHWYSWRDAFGTLVLAEMQHYRPHSVFI